MSEFKIEKGFPVPEPGVRRMRKMHNDDVPDMSKLPPDALLTREQLHRLTGFSLPTLKRWAAMGKGPRITRVEGLPRFKVRDVRQWMGVENEQP